MDNKKVMNVKLGLDAESFVKSDLGQYLLERAATESLSSLEQLKDIDPSDTDKIRKIQAICKRMDDLQRWITEAINEGNNAYQQIVSDNELDHED